MIRNLALTLAFAFVSATALAQANEPNTAAGTTETQDANASLGDNTAKPAKSTKHNVDKKKKKKHHKKGGHKKSHKDSEPGH